MSKVHYNNGKEIDFGCGMHHMSKKGVMKTIIDKEDFYKPFFEKVELVEKEKPENCSIYYNYVEKGTIFAVHCHKNKKHNYIVVLERNGSISDYAISKIHYEHYNITVETMEFNNPEHFMILHEVLLDE